MADDTIRYDVLVQDALRGVMRKVLQEVVHTGLPGDHHFFITFDTNAPGVRISTRLKEKYPDQMTIVMQFQFWDLKVTDAGFEIGLSFNDIPEKLIVPFASVRGFYDPNVNFELEFDVNIPSPLSASIASLPNAMSDEEAETKSDLADNNDAENASKKQDDADGNTEPAGSGEVVSLDSFRRKK